MGAGYMEVAMKTPSIRIPDDMMSALQLVGKEEKIEPSTAMRKLVRIGYESYKEETIRIINARAASKGERKIYEEG
jgi:uncharacterized DUF497 family protein